MAMVGVNDCAEEINLSTTDISPLVGECSTPGDINTGHRLADVLIDDPSGIAHDGVCCVFVAHSNKLIQANIDTNETVLLHEYDGHVTRQIQFQADQSALFIVLRHGFGKYDFTANKSTIYFHLNGHVLGSFDESKITEPTGLVRTTENGWLLGDPLRDRSVIQANLQYRLP